jgi:hypothetical protein
MENYKPEPKEYTHFKGFKTHEVQINSIDISPIVAEMEIYQDLFSPYWSASLLISDANNAMHQHDFTQGDRVNIKIVAKDDTEHTFKFIIYQIGERGLITQQHYGYQIQAVNEAFFKDAKIRISKQFDEKKADVAIREILGKIGGTDLVSQTNGQFSWIVPNMSPFAAAQWIAKWAIAKKSGAADILLFQQKENEWSWGSAEEMFTDPARKSIKIEKFYMLPANQRDDKGEAEKDYTFAMEQYKFINHMNLLHSVYSGAIANTTLVHDLVKRKASTNKFNYGQDVAADASNATFKNMDGLELANLAYHTIAPGNAGEGKESPNDNHQKWLGSRKSSMQKFETNRLLVSIPGNIDIVDELGKWTMVELPTQEDITDDVLDLNYGNRYLITAMRHIWTQKSYTTFVELGKKRLKL